MGINKKKISRKQAHLAWHDAFLAMHGYIRARATFAFRHLDAEAREEAVHEVICNACCTYARLVERGRTEVAHAGILARHGIAQTKAGRKVGGNLRCRDVLSERCQLQKRVVVERLDHYDPEESGWQEVLVEDRHAGPAEIATARVDFSAWLRTLPRRFRRIATFLATGETTNAAALKFNVSAGRISQVRKELCLAWHRFQGEEPAIALA